MLDYKLWIGFTEYILDKASRVSRDSANASMLRMELKRCQKEKRELSSYWRLLASLLFDKFNIKDKRLNFGEPLSEIAYSIDGKEFTTKIEYILDDVKKFPAESRLVENISGKDEKEFAIMTMKSFIKRYQNVDTDTIFAYQNSLNIIVNE